MAIDQHEESIVLNDLCTLARFSIGSRFPGQNSNPLCNSSIQCCISKEAIEKIHLHHQVSKNTPKKSKLKCSIYSLYPSNSLNGRISPWVRIDKPCMKHHETWRLPFAGVGNSWTTKQVCRENVRQVILWDSINSPLKAGNPINHQPQIASSNITCEKLHSLKPTAKAPAMLSHPERKLIFQPSIFRGEPLVSGRVPVQVWTINSI